jgi:hypothetical protein
MHGVLRLRRRGRLLVSVAARGAAVSERLTRSRRPGGLSMAAPRQRPRMVPPDQCCRTIRFHDLLNFQSLSLSEAGSNIPLAAAPPGAATPLPDSSGACSLSSGVRSDLHSRQQQQPMAVSGRRGSAGLTGDSVGSIRTRRLQLSVSFNSTPSLLPLSYSVSMTLLAHT